MLYFLLTSILLWKGIDIAVSLVAPQFIPYLGFFSYGDTMFKYGLPDFIRKLSNFDGIMYSRIATAGYSTTEQAYFPLYPLLIRGVTYFTHNPIIAGILLSLVLGVVGIVLYSKYIAHLIKPVAMKWVLLALISYPTSYYFGVMYTEGLFFALLTASLFCLYKQRFVLAFVCAYLLALTRVQGVFLLIPIATFILGAWRRSERWWPYVTTALGSLLGLGTYMTYLWQSVHDPLYFFHAQESFGANRSSHLITLPQVLYRYARIFLTADLSFQYYVAILEFAFFLFALILLTYDLYLNLKKARVNFERLGLTLFSFANILVPALTGTLTAMPRYTLMSLSLYLVIGELRATWLRSLLLALFVILHIVLYSLFIQGYYVT